MFILPFGYDGPGITPTIIVHLVLQRSCLGKLMFNLPNPYLRMAILK